MLTGLVAYCREVLVEGVSDFRRVSVGSAAVLDCAWRDSLGSVGGNEGAEDACLGLFVILVLSKLFLCMPGFGGFDHLMEFVSNPGVPFDSILGRVL